MFSTPAEASSANLEIVCFEWRWGGSQSLHKREDAGLGYGVSRSVHPRQS